MAMISTMVPPLVEAHLILSLPCRKAHKQIVFLKNRGKVDGIIVLSVVALDTVESPFQRNEEYLPCLVGQRLVVRTSGKADRKK